MFFRVPDFLTLVASVRKYSFRFFIISSAFSQIVLSQGVAQIEQLCADLTETNKKLALQAGYDLDQLCGNLQFAKNIEKKPVPPMPAIPRETISSFDKLSTTVAPLASTDTGIVTVDTDLKPFGYGLFANIPTTFTPSAGIPVSGDYLLGPGDSLDILFYGKVNSAFTLEINREGFVDFPELGPVGLAGLTYGEAKEMLRARIAAQIIGTQVSISMGTLRSMQIFVLGEAFKPGAYTVSSLSTITHALISSGGISDIGSLRNVELKRQGRTVAVLDLYDLLLLGDTTHDLRLQAADVIFIPTVGARVSVDGHVLRPAIYELKGNESVAELIELAGGLSSTAFPQSSKLERIDTSGFLTVFDLNLNSPQGEEFKLSDGDHLSIGAVTEYKKDIITLSGAVRHEGDIAWRPELRVLDVISNGKLLMPDAYLKQAVLVSEMADKPNIQVSIINLEKALEDPLSKDNVLLHSRDEILFFYRYQNRAETLAPFVNQLERQAEFGKVSKIVVSEGEVRFPGKYPLTDEMTLNSLIRLSGGLLESGYSKSAEIASLDFSNPDRVMSTIKVVDLKNSSSQALKPMDHVIFRKAPDFKVVETVTLKGEFIFPGTYVIQRGETLSSVVRRAGGTSENAFVEGSVFLRESLRLREEEELERLSLLLEQQQKANLREQQDSFFSTSSASDSTDSVISMFKDSLSQAKASGRLVIDFSNIMRGFSEDPILQDNDRLFVPKASQEVTVIGEVQRPMSHFYDANLSLDDYLRKSGGLTLLADKSRIFAVRANGEAVMPKRGPFHIVKARSLKIYSGDTIIVPLDQNDKKLRGFPLLSEVSQVIYQLSLGAAALNALESN